MATAAATDDVADVVVVDGADADVVELRAVERRATRASGDARGDDVRRARGRTGGARGRGDDAARRAHARAGVLEYDVDHRGVQVPSSARRFSMTASHRRVGASSVSLALYLDTVLQFGLLALVLAGINAYSLTTNVTDKAFTASYAVTGWDATAGAERDDDVREDVRDGRLGAEHEPRVEVWSPDVGEFL